MGLVRNYRGAGNGLVRKALGEENPVGPPPALLPTILREEEHQLPATDVCQDIRPTFLREPIPIR